MTEEWFVLTSPFLCKTFPVKLYYENPTDYRVNPVKTALEIDRNALVQAFVVEGLDEKAVLAAAGVEARMYRRRVGHRF
jgi:hypothetical protein